MSFDYSALRHFHGIIIPMSIHIDKGDFLTFASIGRAVGIDEFNFFYCEIEPGVWRRHWNLQVHESRSDISREGYLGVILWCICNPGARSKRILNNIIDAGWRRKWTMGNRGNFDYVNIFPLIPILYAARFGKRVPTYPLLPIFTLKTGYRAHLVALQILMERLIGKKKWSHKWATKQLVKHNPDNVWFQILKARVHGDDKDFSQEIASLNMEEAAYGWGSCPGEVYRGLCIKTSEL